MRPTVRGVAVALVAVIAIGMAATSGARALNAVAAPAIVALVAGAGQLVLGETPTVERTDPDPGFPGETRTVEIAVEGSSLARIDDDVPAGVTTADHERRVSLPATVAYDVDLAERGAWRVGPPTVTLTDVLGLFVRRTRPDATATLVVYPPVRPLQQDGAIAALFDRSRVAERQTFDTIREYAPGDPLRNVHWKSSAKRDAADLVVKQFVGERADSDFHLTASAESGYSNAMASAAASVADAALSAGLSVGLTCPAGELAADRGERHRHRLLELLARTGDGDPGDSATERADATVHAGATGVTATFEGREHVLAVPADGAETAEEVRG